MKRPTDDFDVLDVIHQVNKGLVLAVIATLEGDARARFATALAGAAAVPVLHPLASQALSNLADAALAFSRTPGPTEGH